MIRVVAVVAGAMMVVMKTTVVVGVVGWIVVEAKIVDDGS